VLTVVMGVPAASGVVMVLKIGALAAAFMGAPTGVPMTIVEPAPLVVVIVLNIGAPMGVTMMIGAPAAFVVVMVLIYGALAAAFIGVLMVVTEVVVLPAALVVVMVLITGIGIGTLAIVSMGALTGPGVTVVTEVILAP